MGAKVGNDATRGHTVRMEAKIWATYENKDRTGCIGGLLGLNHANTPLGKEISEHGKTKPLTIFWPRNPPGEA